MNEVLNWILEHRARRRPGVAHPARRGRDLLRDLDPDRPGRARRHRRDRRGDRDDELVEYVALLIAVVVGALGGESVGFALGHYFGPKIRTSRLGRRIGESHWVRAENYLDRRGGIAVFISRFLPILHSLIPLTVGMSTMRYRKFIAWTAPACIIWATRLRFGRLGGRRFVSAPLPQRLHFAGYIFVAIIVVFIVLVVVVKRLIERREARHMDHPGDGDANTPDDRGLRTNRAGAEAPALSIYRARYGCSR